MLAIGLLFILLVTGFASVNFGAVGRGMRELQLAVDNAATSAANQLCSDKKCYQAARKAAVEVISQHRAISSIGMANQLEITQMSIPDNEYTWDVPEQNLQITIERGVWSKGEFISFEGDWQAQHPGIPAFVAANAVKIQAIRPEVTLFNFGGSSDHIRLVGSAVAVKGSTEPTGVSFFALPVCAVINNGGDYYGTQTPYEMCSGNRNFTRPDRYNRAPSSFYKFAVPPAFSYEPCNADAANAQYQVSVNACRPGPNNQQICWDQPIGNGPRAQEGMVLFDHHSGLENFLSDIFGSPDPINPADGSSCALLHGNFDGLDPYSQMPQYGTVDTGYVSGFGGRTKLYQPKLNRGMHYEDLYGVVGLPGDPPGDIEEEIQESLLASRAPTWNAQVGDEFHILANGLTSPVTDSLLWDAIINGQNGTPGISDDTHPRLSDTTLKTFDRVTSVFRALVYPWDPNNAWIAHKFTTYSSSTNLPGIDLPMPDYYATVNYWQNNLEWLFPGANQSDGMCNSKWARFDNFQLHSDGDYSKPYYVTAQDVRTPGLDDRTPVMHVVIPVIGDPASDARSCYGIDSTAAEDPKLDAGRTFMVVGFVDGYVFDTDIGNPKPEANFAFSSFQHRLKGFSFMDGNPDVPSCNIVRSRLSCKQWFVPDANLMPNPTAVLVN